MTMCQNFFFQIFEKTVAISSKFYTTVRLVIFVGLIFHGLGSSDNFVGLYFCGVPTLIT